MRDGVERSSARDRQEGRWTCPRIRLWTEIRMASGDTSRGPEPLRREIVAATPEAGAWVAAVARRYGVMSFCKRGMRPHPDSPSAPMGVLPLWAVRRI